MACWLFNLGIIAAVGNELVDSQRVKLEEQVVSFCMIWLREAKKIELEDK